jgi:Domain of unknown function (DUF4397)
MLTASKYLLAGAALTLAAGCSGSRTDRPVVTTRDDGQVSASPAGTEAARHGKTLVRLVNAMPSTRAIDVSGEDRTLFIGTGYKGVTPYKEVSDNVVNFRLRAAGSDSVLADNHETMRDGSRYTIIAYPGDKGDPNLKIIRDELSPAAGKARIRVINAAPDLGTVDVAMQGQKVPLFANLREGVEAGFVDIDPVNGTVDIRSSTKIKQPAQLRDQHFEAGRTYTIVLAGWGTRQIDAITFDDAVTASAPILSLFNRP